jgi:hypothetical protein
MIIYLAGTQGGGFGLGSEGGREEELLLKLGVWRRLVSYFFYNSLDDLQLFVLRRKYAEETLSETLG